MVCSVRPVLAQVEELFFIFYLVVVGALFGRAMEYAAFCSSRKSFEGDQEHCLDCADVCMEDGDQLERKALQCAPGEKGFSEYETHLLASETECSKVFHGNLDTSEFFEKDVACSMSVWYASYTACQLIERILKDDDDEHIHLSDWDVQLLNEAHLVFDCVLQWDSAYDLRGVYRSMETLQHMRQSWDRETVAYNRLTQILNWVTDCLTWMIQLDVAYGDRGAYCNVLDRLWLSGQLDVAHGDRGAYCNVLERLWSSGKKGVFLSRMLNSYQKCICQFPSKAAARNLKNRSKVHGARLRRER